MGCALSIGCARGHRAILGPTFTLSRVLLRSPLHIKISAPMRQSLSGRKTLTQPCHGLMLRRPGPRIAMIWRFLEQAPGTITKYAVKALRFGVVDHIRHASIPSCRHMASWSVSSRFKSVFHGQAMYVNFPVARCVTRYTAPLARPL